MDRILALLLFLCVTITVANGDNDGFVQPGTGPTFVIPDKSLFVFGDSLSDPGNNAFLNPTEHIPANHYPYGWSYFAKATGRLSDGLILPDFIGMYAGTNIVLPYLHGDVDLTEGANFASAGAGVIPENPKVMNFPTQVEALKNVTVKWTDTFGSVEANIKLRNAVYLIALGSNDYVGFSIEYPNATIDQQRDRVDKVISAYMDGIKEIYKLGGRKFAIQNVPPLGCLPAVKKIHDMVSGDCADLPLTLATKHNTALSVAFAKFAADPIHPDVKYGIFDYYTKLGDLIDNPTNYGMQYSANWGRNTNSPNLLGAAYLARLYQRDTWQGLFTTFIPFYYRLNFSKVACCGSGLFIGGDCGTEPYVMCTNPGAYVFFDGGHTGQRTNNILAKMFWEGSEDVIKPYNIKQLFELVLPAPVVPAESDGRDEL